MSESYKTNISDNYDDNTINQFYFIRKELPGFLPWTFIQHLVDYHYNGENDSFFKTYKTLTKIKKENCLLQSCEKPGLEYSLKKFDDRTVRGKNCLDILKCFMTNNIEKTMDTLNCIIHHDPSMQYDIFLLGKCGRILWIDREKRENRISGSDVSIILGENPYSSLETLIKNKTDGYKEEKKLIFEVGKALEPVVLAEFNRLNYTNHLNSLNTRIRFDRKYPWLTGTLDVMSDIVPGDPYPKDVDYIVEIKTTSVKSFDRNWDNTKIDGIPIYYKAQIQLYMYLSGVRAKKCYVPVLVGNDYFECFICTRDDDYIDNLVKQSNNFFYKYMLKDR